MSASGPWRRQIGPPKGRISAYLKELTDRPIEPKLDDQVGRQENVDLLEAINARILLEINRLTKAIELIDKAHDAWVAHIASLVQYGAAKVEPNR
jgi:hypothetical protein